MVTTLSVPHSDREAETLVLVLHAFDDAPTDMDSIRMAVMELHPTSHVVIPRLPLRRAARVNPLDVARSLLDLIEDQITFREEKDWPEFEEIVLIGHSMGALLARKVYLLAGPESAEARFEGSLAGPLAMERPWFRKINRIILFAGMNRGWTLNHHRHFFRFIAWWILSFAADTFLAFIGDKKPFSIMHIRKSALFD
jgi:pimeloyl-ACP methyl ester carboxylesterase